MSKFVLLALLSFALAGCASPPVSKLQLPDPTTRAEVLVFREYTFNAGGVTLAFGANNNALVKLENSEFASILLAPGTYNFFVQARTAKPTVATTTLKAGDRKCLRAVADPGNLTRVIVPFLMMSTGYLFLLNEVRCPSNAELAKYSRVNVDYTN
jgi:hypothetical protein